jgi:uncharacterized protein with HEPN domain
VTVSSPSKIARYLTQTIENIERIEGYIAGLNESAFAADLKTADAVERCLQRVIEALYRVKQKGGEQLLPDLPWCDIQGLGNRLRHEYDSIDVQQIWLTVKHDLPALKEKCATALTRL